MCRTIACLAALVILGVLIVLPARSRGRTTPCRQAARRSQFLGCRVLGDKAPQPGLRLASLGTKRKIDDASKKLDFLLALENNNLAEL